jgi:hypothetical protein
LALLGYNILRDAAVVASPVFGIPVGSISNR